MATVRKRVRTAANGEEKIAWVADYHDQLKVRHLKTFPTRKAAAAWLVETQGEVVLGVHTPERTSINVWEAAQLWLERGIGEALERGVPYAAMTRWCGCTSAPHSARSNWRSSPPRCSKAGATVWLAGARAAARATC